MEKKGPPSRREGCRVKKEWEKSWKSKRGVRGKKGKRKTSRGEKEKQQED